MSSDAALSSDNAAATPSNAVTGTGSEAGGEKRIPHIRIVPHIVDVRHCLYFDVMNREVGEGTVLKVGRFTEKVSQQMSRIAFKSKVVSRSHAEIWTEGGQFFIKDTKSSSGTFLNHIRLSPPGVESRPHPLHDGDILQLGVDYQGGTLDIYKCVKIRLEINRNWQRSKENPFRQQVMQNIQNAYHSMGTGAPGAVGGDAANSECCICLYQMVAFQALFVAPCSHCFHFKCVKPILFTSTGFSCPLCRTYADLEASVTVDENEMDVDARGPVQPAILPPAVQQASASAAVAAAAAVAAIDAAISGEGGDSGDMEGVAGAIPMAERDDANSTPVPSEQAATDSFSSTPVGSLQTHQSQLGSLAAAAAATGGNDDGNESSDMHVVSSPGRGADGTACVAGQQQPGQQQQPGAAAPSSPGSNA
ncbi:hypothetical protein LPJ53_004284 [Coemansia erecta]|uniref:SMAD/FHA domain-containing protein n=1 Tax=Coemansia erecta TaxID=147472 RepID=A0A9W8CPC6_9FUNG|nr:hypothetical protein LPJ53_004284 [Coemansia erecta]